MDTDTAHLFRSLAKGTRFARPPPPKPLHPTNTVTTTTTASSSSTDPLNFFQTQQQQQQKLTRPIIQIVKKNNTLDNRDDRDDSDDEDEEEEIDIEKPVEFEKSKKKTTTTTPKQLEIVKDTSDDEEEEEEEEQEEEEEVDDEKEEGDEEEEEVDIETLDSERQATPLETVEQISLFRKKNRINVSGTSAPKPFEFFHQLSQRYDLRQFLAENIPKCNLQIPTPIQMQTIPILLENRDVLACAPTGSGKTFAYLIPILHFLKNPAKVGFRALIIVPTRELAQQIVRECKRICGDKRFRISCPTKAESNSPNLGEGYNKNHDILISTPMRLVKMIQSKQLDLSTVQYLVLDEGDRLLEQGFLEQVDEVLASCTNENRLSCLFSATLSPGIEQLARSVMKDPIRVVIGLRNTTTNTIKQSLKYVGNEQGKLLAMRQLISTGVKPPVLIFVQSIERAQELYRELIYDGVNVDVIHSDRPQSQRDDIITKFRTRKIWFLICTDLMARGIDFKGVELVVNYDFPQSTVSYIHRIGRTGRSGNIGEAITFFTNDDVDFLRSIATVMKQSGCDIPEWMLQMKKTTKKQRKWLATHAPHRKPVGGNTYTVGQSSKPLKRKRNNNTAKSTNSNNNNSNKKSRISGDEK